jgi:mannose-6-phosphate isomerase
VSAEIHAQVGLGLKVGTSKSDFEAAVRRGDRADALLNWIYVKPGEMIYNPAGTVHAIGPGSVLLEVQQNSDVTYRLYDYGRPRELHLEKGFRSMNDRARPGKVRPLGDTSTSLWVLPHFLVLRGNLEKGKVVQQPNGRPHVVIVLTGCGRLVVKDKEEVTVAAGEAAIIPAAVESYEIHPQWDLDFVCASLPGGEVPEPEIA